jgi:hypothetical protein
VLILVSLTTGAGSDTHRSGSCPKSDCYMPEGAIRLVACLTMCLTPILASATQADAQAPSDPQAYCVNRSADFYPYTGELCKSGYQLGSGNCRKADGRMVAVSKEDCVAMGGLVAFISKTGQCRVRHIATSASQFASRMMSLLGAPHQWLTITRL